MRVNIENATKQAKINCSDVLSKINFANQTMKMCKDFVTKHYEKSSCSGTTLTYAKKQSSNKNVI